ARAAGAGRAIRADRPVPDDARAGPRAAPEARRPGAGGGAGVSRIDDYRQVAPPGVVDVIQKLAERVRGRRFLNLTGGRLGGGVAEILRTAVPILSDLGVDTSWGIPMYVVEPSIDPLSEKNRELSTRELTDILTSLRVVRDKPLLVQIGSFTHGDDPIGVVNAYRLVKKHHDVRLVLAGTGGDEPDRVEIGNELREAAREDPDVLVLELPAEAYRQINALQRAATIVLQKSVRAGFELGPAEAMWK